jgi:NAD(P)-dependent dehydrogenase (short-subunit alcohol dehydrogenase family)
MSDSRERDTHGGASAAGPAISEEPTVLVLGGTGRTGGRVVEQLLGRGVRVRVIVRSAERLPASVAENPKLSVVEADLLALTDEELARVVSGCDAAVSCLGHNLNLKGVYGAPRDLVTRATRRVCRAIQASRPERPAKYVLMSSVSVNHPKVADARRGALEKGFVALIRGLLPPARDNQRASDFLCREIGSADPFVEWVAVRPDSLLDGEVTEYTVHEQLVSSLFKPDETNMSNVAHFMCELVADQAAWDRWRGGLPVVVNDQVAQ